MLHPETPALILAPMDGITDAPMRALQGEVGAFSFAVSEFLRVSIDTLPMKVFRRDVPELCSGGLTPTGLPVVVQILGGDATRMAETALNAYRAGARAIDINFGCPAPTVNRNDGGATLLNHPCRIREIVSAVRAMVPPDASVSAKVRLGWDSIDAVYENAAMAAEGGASWLTIHARTRVQGYAPPVYWKPIGVVREKLAIPVVANGDIWSLNDFRKCRDETGCSHFMIGRSALANPALSHQIAHELGLEGDQMPTTDWIELLNGLLRWTDFYEHKVAIRGVQRLKQWMNLAAKHGDFSGFDQVKRTETLAEFFNALRKELDQAA
jgi:tRNA-dihydrouridine synthase C